MAKSMRAHGQNRDGGGGCMVILLPTFITAVSGVIYLIW